MRIYFSGIGGVAIGPLAEIARDAGYEVCGSDLAAGLMTQQLQKKGVDVHIGAQDGTFLHKQHALSPFDLVVYTAALPADHPELEMARQLGIRTVKRDELLAEIIREKNLKLIAIAGTHGKTTTTGMMIWVFKQLGIPVSYSVGTTLSWGPSGYFDPESAYFIYECDEFDRNFLHFEPYASIITTIEYDHPDTYPTEQEYFDAFDQFIHQSKFCVMWQHDFNIESIYGSDVRAHLIDRQGAETDKKIESLKIAGRHNRENAYLILTECLDGYLDEDQIIKALESFPGTNRRFEKIADNLFTDYGHTPTEISATLQMARELSDHVALVYQPHQNIRQHEIIQQYKPEVFTDADEIYWLPTYLSRENPNLEVLTPEQLTAQLDTTKVHISEMNDTLQVAIKQHLDAGHLVVCMGAGSIDEWVRKQFLR